MPTVGEIGEFPLIERIAIAIENAKLSPPTAGGFKLKLGIGDDTAAWSLERGIEVSTTDTVVEDVHFTRETTPWRDLGWKLWAANVSDVISMGAVPLVGLVTLGLPSDLQVEDVDNLYKGIIDACQHYGTLLAGGDIVRSRHIFATVALNGVSDGEPLRRDVARPGHAVGVSGPLGASNGALRLLLDGKPAPDALLSAHRHPMPRVSTGLALKEAGVTGAMDVSDGLVGDVAKLCRASGIGATIDARNVPIASALSEVFDDEVALMCALGGGEDYELIFTGTSDAVERACAMIEGAMVIGEIVEAEPGSVRVIGPDGHDLDVAHVGWEHLAS